jgi:hypothetical protein
MLVFFGGGGAVAVKLRPVERNVKVELWYSEALWRRAAAQEFSGRLLLKLSPHGCEGEGSCGVQTLRSGGGVDGTERAEMLGQLMGELLRLAERYAKCEVDTSGACRSVAAWKRIGAAVEQGMFCGSSECVCEDILGEGTELYACEACAAWRRRGWKLYLEKDGCAETPCTRLRASE